MSVAMYAGRFPAVSETFIMRQACALRATVYRKTSDDTVEVPHDIKVVQLPYREDGQFEGKWRRRFHTLWQAARYGNTYLMDSTTEEAFYTALVESNPDIVLAQYGTVGLQLMRPCMKAGIRIAVHFHGFDLSKEYRDRWYRFSCRQLVRVAGALVAVNKVQRERLLRLGAASEKIHLIPCGVPVEEFTPSESVGEQPCRFLAVGRFVAKKCPMNTIRAFAQCLTSCDGATLTMIGDGPLRTECQRLADELRIAEHVQFMGSQPSEVVRNQMLTAGAFVQHSVTPPDGDEEGWPVAIGESMACGLPIIATRHPGIMDQVVHGATGFLVDEGDWKGMADHMVALARNPELRQEMGNAGRRRIEKIGNLRDSIARLEDALTQALV